jgi:hypothetical protein
VNEGWLLRVLGKVQTENRYENSKIGLEWGEIAYPMYESPKIGLAWAKRVFMRSGPCDTALLPTSGVVGLRR